MLVQTNSGLENPTSNIATKFLFKNRKLISKRAKWNEKNEDRFIHLEECRDLLQQQRDTEVPRDLPYSYGNTISIFNENGVPHIQFVKHDQTRSNPIRFTQRGWDSFTRDVLPKSGKYLMQELAIMQPKLATLSTNTFTLSKRDDFRTFRTIEMEMENGQMDRVVRFIHKTTQGSYTAIDNLELFNMLLDEPILRDSHVLDFNVQDIGMRCRFLLCPREELTVLNKVYPAMEVRNSEVGMGSVYLGAMGIRPSCDNGMHSVSVQGVHRFAHRWDPNRIANNIVGAREDILSHANGICSIHQQALDVAIDSLDLEHFLMTELKKEGFNKSEVNKVIDSGMSHPTTTALPCLAQGLDAITIMAQEYNTSRQLEMEIAASKIGKRGLAQFA